MKSKVKKPVVKESKAPTVTKTVERDLKYNYPADCKSKEDRKTFRRTARSTYARLTKAAKAKDAKPEVKKELEKFTKLVYA